MASTLKGNVSVSLTGTLSQPVDDLSNTQNALAAGVKYSQSFTNGTGAGEVNAEYHKTRSLASSGTESLDLSGSLLDPFGVTLVFTSIKLMKITNRSEKESLWVGGAASNAFVNWVKDATDRIVIPPLGCFLLVAPNAAGFAVTAATGDILKVAAAGDGDGSGVVYDIELFGTV